jgi:hypothetical protein
MIHTSNILGMNAFLSLVGELKGADKWDEHKLLERISDALKYKNYWIGKYVIEILVSLDHEKLIRMFNCSKLATIHSITEILGDSSDIRAVGPLSILLHSAKEWKVQYLASGALNKLAGKFPESDSTSKNFIILDTPVSERVLEISRTDQAPFVHFDIERGILLIRGRIADDSEKIMDIFKIVTDELELFYLKHQADQLVVGLCIEYFRTGCGKLILDFLKRLEKKANTTVFWYYTAGDEDMIESGEDFESIIRVPFRQIEIPDQVDFWFDFTNIKYIV